MTDFTRTAVVTVALALIHSCVMSALEVDVAMPLQHLDGESVRGRSAARRASHVTQLCSLRSRLDAARDVGPVRVSVVPKVVHLGTKNV